MEVTEVINLMLLHKRSLSIVIAPLAKGDFKSIVINTKKRMTLENEKSE